MIVKLKSIGLQFHEEQSGRKKKAGLPPQTQEVDSTWKISHFVVLVLGGYLVSSICQIQSKGTRLKAKVKGLGGKKCVMHREILNST